MAISKHKYGFRVNVYVGDLNLPSPHKGKKRLTKVLPTLREAKQLEREWEQMKEDAKSQATGVSVGEWAKTYLDLPRNPTTTKTYTYSLKGFVEEHGATALLDWTPQAARVESARRPKSQVKHIKQLFQAAVDHGLLTASPFKDVKGVERNDPKHTKQAFHAVWPIDPQKQVEVLDRILDAAGEVGGQDIRAKIAFAAWTGCRPGEIRGLYREDVDLASGFAWIRRVIDRNNTERMGTKSGLHRKVLVAPQAINEIRALTPHLSDPHLFTNNGKPWTANTFHGYWERVRIKAEVKMRFYDLRHFCATQLLELGASPEDVAAQLGHSDGGALVRQVYGHPSHDRALERLRHTMQAHTPAGSSQVRHIDFGESA